MKEELFVLPTTNFNDDVVYISKDGFLFSIPHKVYSTNIFRNGELVLSIDNFFARHVEEFKDSFLIFGFFFDEISFVRRGGIINLSKCLDVVSKRVFDDLAFSDFVWGDSTVVCANCYDSSENLFRGYIFRYDGERFYRVKIDPILFGEYEFRGGVKIGEGEYLFFGVDKDNFRGFVLESNLKESYLHDVSIDSELWDIVGCSYFDEGTFIFVGNEWRSYPRGFMLLFEKGNHTYVPIDYDSSWFEVSWCARVGKVIFVSLFDFDSSQNCLLRFNGVKFDVILKDAHSKFVYSNNEIFVLSRGLVEEFVIE